MTILYIIIGILIFGLLIIVHELGHFLAAKACNVKVNEFSVGAGPALWKKQKGETLYALRAIPVMGYCAMEGEDEEAEDPDDPRALSNQGFWKKLLIFAAGAAMNFLTGFLIMVVLYAGAAGFYTPNIAGFDEDCSLDCEGGLQVGDRLLSIDGERVYICSDITLLLGLSTNGTVDMVVERGGEKVTLRNVPAVCREYTDQYGETYEAYGIIPGVKKADFGDRLAYSWNGTLDFVRLVRLSLRMLVTGQAGVRDLSGPVGLVSTITEVGQQSENVRAAIDNILYLGALIAVNLAVMNLLPLPALDGGKIFFLVVNAIAMALLRKQIPAKYENYIHFAGLVLLLALMAVVTFSDIWKLFT